jgi:hypothetical protein
LLLELATDLVAREPRQTDVKNNKLGAFASGFLERFLPTDRLTRGIARLSQASGNKRSKISVIVNDQDVPLARWCRSPLAPDWVVTDSFGVLTDARLDIKPGGSGRIPSEDGDSKIRMPPDVRLLV